MTKNAEDVLKRMDLAPKVRSFLAKGEYKAKSYYYRPGGQLPLSASDRIKRSLTTGSSGLSKDARNTVENVKFVAGRVAIASVPASLGAAVVCPPLVGAALAAGTYAGFTIGVTDDMIHRDNKSQVEVAAMNKLLGVSHERARVKYTDIPIPIEGLKKIEQIIESMITRLADWIYDVEYERAYEANYNTTMLKLEKDQANIYNPDVYNKIKKGMRLPDYKLLKSAEGLSIEKMEEGLITLAGSQIVARCLRAELEGSHKARPGGVYTGWVYNVDQEIVKQAVICGYSGQYIATIKYHRGDILNIKELEENKTYTIYCGPNGKATAERIDDVLLEKDTNSCVVESRGR